MKGCLTDFIKEDRRSPQRRRCLVLRVDRSGTMRELGFALLERIDWVGKRTDEYTVLFYV
jgi:hypothetical protein